MFLMRGLKLFIKLVIEQVKLGLVMMMMAFLLFVMLMMLGLLLVVGRDIGGYFGGGIGSGETVSMRVVVVSVATHAALMLDVLVFTRNMVALSHGVLVSWTMMRALVVDIMVGVLGVMGLTGVTVGVVMHKFSLLFGILGLHLHYKVAVRGVDVVG